MNLGVSSVAAPNAASSRTARYASTAAHRVWRQPRGTVDPGGLTHLGPDQAGVDGKAFAADQTFVDATLQHGLEQPPQQIAVAEPAVAVLREGRMIRHRTAGPEAAEPPVGQVQVNFFAEPTLRADAKTVTDDQHPDHQLRIDRGSPLLAIERRQLAPHPVKFHKPVDRAQKVPLGHMIFERKLVKQGVLTDATFPHHRLHPSPQRPE